MLLEFRTKNYKSFKDELVFSMIPAPKQKGLDYSILKQKIGSKNYRALCSAVIYGPNASGKSNIIGAMETLSEIMLRGHIRNTTEGKSPNAAAYFLDLIPNCDNDGSVPVEFSIKFIHSNLLFEYAISMLIGKFAEKDFNRKIKLEKLSVNEKLVFSRDNNKLSLGDFKVIKGYIAKNSEEDKATALNLAENNLNDEELFLTNGFKNIFSAKLVTVISDWLDNKFFVNYYRFLLGATSTQRVDNFNKKHLHMSELLDFMAIYFGVKSNKIGFLDDNDANSTLVSVINDRFNAKDNIIIPANFFESYGTIRLTHMIPMIIKVIRDGGTLIVDELDASIHPMAVMSLINIFHNDDINVNHAQLIFNTHNPIFLNSNLFRRDEIKFVDRDDETHSSTHYSLSDFKTTGDTGVRPGDYLKNYFINRYGAIKDIDFTSLFENIIKIEKEKVALNDGQEVSEPETK